MATVLMIFLSICNFYAVGPWYNFQKRTFSRQNTFEYYRVGILLFLVLSSILSEFYISYSPHSLILKMAIYLERFGEFSMAFILVYYSTKKMDHWKCLLAEKRYLDISLKYLEDTSNNVRCWKFWIFYSISFGYIVYELGKAIINVKKPFFLLILTPRLIYNHGFMISAIVSSNLADNLKSASERLKVMVTTKELSDSERKFTDDLKEMRKLYNAILKKTHSFNEVFGHFLFVAMCHQMVSSSGILGFLFHKLHDEPDVGILTLPARMFFVNMLGLLFAIICCDETMREGKHFLWTCYVREGNIIRGHCRDELAQFTEYVKDYPVVFTAADFFDLTRNNLLGHMSIVATYSIVFIQFT